MVLKLGILILILACIIAVLYIFYLKSQVKSIKMQLDDISSRKSEKKIDIALLDKDIEKLAESINRNIDFQKQLRIDVLRNEESLKNSIANISHDLRTPLTSILGHLQLIEMDNLSEHQKDKIQIIINKAKTMQQLIESFFEICVLERDDSPQNVEKINLNNLLSNTLIENIDIFEKANISPIFDICKQTIIINTDKLILQRIIQNLISNMVKYAHGYTKIILTQDYNKCKNNSNIKDTAVKMIFENKIESPEKIDVENIFNKFYTADKSRNSGSTGLGLTIVKVLVEKLNGKVIAELKEDILIIKVLLGA